MEFHPQFRFLKTQRQHLIDAGNLLQIILHRARGGAQGLVVGLTGQHHHGGGKTVGGGDFQDFRVQRLHRQFGVGLVLDFAAQVVDPLVEHPHRDVAKAHQDVGDALARGTDHELHVLHVADRIFQRVGDALFHILGGGARQGGGDVHPVEVDFRVLLARHVGIGEQTHQNHHHEGDVGQRVIGDQRLDEAHISALPRRRSPAGRRSILAGRAPPPAFRAAASRRRAGLPERRARARNGRGRFPPRTRPGLDHA